MVAGADIQNIHRPAVVKRKTVWGRSEQGTKEKDDDGERERGNVAPGIQDSDASKTPPLYPATMDEKTCLCTNSRTLFLSRVPLLPGIMSLYPSAGSRTRLEHCTRTLCWRLEILNLYFLAVFSLSSTVFKLPRGTVMGARRDHSCAGGEESPSKTDLQDSFRLCGHDLNAINTVIISSQRENSSYYHPVSSHETDNGMDYRFTGITAWWFKYSFFLN